MIDIEKRKKIENRTVIRVVNILFEFIISTRVYIYVCVHKKRRYYISYLQQTNCSYTFNGNNNKNHSMIYSNSDVTIWFWYENVYQTNIFVPLYITYLLRLVLRVPSQEFLIYSENAQPFRYKIYIRNILFWFFFFFWYGKKYFVLGICGRKIKRNSSAIPSDDVRSR